MKSKLRSGLRLPTIAAAAVLLAPLVAWAGDGPYVVRGNQHLIIGITLDEAAVRAALPKGLEPTEGITGGINIYRSNGGEGVAAYARSYVWADLEGHDSINGSKARYILWAATSTGPDKLEKAGNIEVKGDTALNKNGGDVTGVTTVNGKQVIKTAIKLEDGPKCGPAAGSINYPSLPAPAGSMVMTQYTFTATICSASPVAAELLVDDGHPLSKYRPQKLIWAAFAPDLSFSGSPLIPVKIAAD